MALYSDLQNFLLLWEMVPLLKIGITENLAYLLLHNHP